MAQAKKVQIFVEREADKTLVEDRKSDVILFLVRKRKYFAMLRTIRFRVTVKIQ